MTKAEALSRIENIEGMTGSRAIALVDALDALGLLQMAGQVDQLSKVLDRQRAASAREIKDRLHPTQRVDA